MNAQVVPVEGAVVFSNSGIRTGGIVHTLGSSDILITNGGHYLVTFSVSGSEPNQFALFVNGAVVAGTGYGAAAGAQQNSGHAILSVPNGSILTLRNHTSATAVTLPANPGGAATAVNASVLLQKLN